MEKMEDTQSSLVRMKFEFNLMTEEIRKKSETELHEKQDEIEKNLDTLKKMLKKEKDLTPCLDDKFLIMFLRTRKYNIEAAWKLIKNHYTIRKKYPQIFRNFSPKSSMNVIRENLFYFLPYRNPEGSVLLYSKFGKWNTDTHSWEEILKFNIMCIEMALKNPVTQICGVSVIVDMKGTTWSHFFQCQFSALRCFINTLHDCTPMRKKATHVINESKIFSIVFNLVKPMISEKMRNRMFFHGNDLSSLHKHLPPEILPAELGGKLSNEPNLDFYDSLLKADEEFKIRNKYGYLSKRP